MSPDARALYEALYAAPRLVRTQHLSDEEWTRQMANEPAVRVIEEYLEKVRDEAYDEGYRDGENYGYDSGYSAGRFE